MDKRKVGIEANEKKKGRISGHVKHRASTKARCQIYLTRSTCVVCNKIFRSPRYRLDHVNSGHRSEIGWNKNRVRKGPLLS